LRLMPDRCGHPARHREIKRSEIGVTGKLAK
jgi:hypothetical protein